MAIKLRASAAGVSEHVIHRGNNRQYHRSVMLWEGRYKSYLVQQEAYLIELYCYIEQNPVRAGMEKDSADYSWSSYQCDALGNKRY